MRVIAGLHPVISRILIVPRLDVLGGMQSELADGLYCACGKASSLVLYTMPGQISLHFGRRSTYWHVTKHGVTRRTFKKPPECG